MPRLSYPPIGSHPRSPTNTEVNKAHPGMMTTMYHRIVERTISNTKLLRVPGRIFYTVRCTPFSRPQTKNRAHQDTRTARAVHGPNLEFEVIRPRPAPAVDIWTCSLLPASEVSTLFGAEVVNSGCSTPPVGFCSLRRFYSATYSCRCSLQRIWSIFAVPLSRSQSSSSNRPTQVLSRAESIK